MKVSQEAASAPPSNLDLEPGDEISVGDAVRALITKSANDVAVALAEKIGGSQANFVRLMNAKAKALGMSKTNFENASGLPDPNQVTTARDMITLGLRLQDDFPQHYPLFAMRAFHYSGASHRNHNTLMNRLAGIDGIKTGYTRASGFNLVSSFRRGGRHLVGAVFGGSSAASRNSEMRTLLTRTLARASSVKTRKAAPMLISKLKSEPKLAARPAPKPKPAPLTEPHIQIAAAPQPKPKPKPAPAVTPVPLLAPEPVVEAALEEQPAAEPAADIAAAAETTPAIPVTETAAPAPLEVARVRRVMVEPRQKTKRPKPNPDETTDMAPDELAMLVRETIIEKSTPAISQNSGTLNSDTLNSGTLNSGTLNSGTQNPGTQISMLGAGDVVPPEPVTEPAADPVAAPVVAAPAPVAQPMRAKSAGASSDGSPTAGSHAKLVTASFTKPATATPRQRPAAPSVTAALAQRGMPPSSLQSQAAALRSAPEQKVAALQPSAAAAAPAGAGRFEIQIGAYASVDEAQRSLNAVQARTGNLLTTYPSVTHPVTKGGRQVFRARFRGFDANSAASTCQKLRTQSFDCFVMSAE